MRIKEGEDIYTCLLLNKAHYLNQHPLIFICFSQPTKYLVGTEQGSILTVNKRPKRDIDTNPRVGIDNGRHYGPITALQRNPIHNKFFMSVGDWSVKVLRV